LTLAQEEYIKDMRHLAYMRMMATKEETAMKYNKDDDMVNHPKHYNESGIECIDALAAMLGDGFQSYLQGNIAKYLWRYRYKNGIEDLKKAEWYLRKLIEVTDNEN
tara:strand:+ start:1328 stop:1645 length:318 start_codon:yes stop_codon:yes gene_type:complete